MRLTCKASATIDIGKRGTESNIGQHVSLRCTSLRGACVEGALPLYIHHYMLLGYGLKI
jgi:hypothetical protein